MALDTVLKQARKSSRTIVTFLWCTRLTLARSEMAGLLLLMMEVDQQHVSNCPRSRKCSGAPLTMSIMSYWNHAISRSV
jgi:hypothetical protein